MPSKGRKANTLAAWFRSADERGAEVRAASPVQTAPPARPKAGTAEKIAVAPRERSLTAGTEGSRAEAAAWRSLVPTVAAPAVQAPAASGRTSPGRQRPATTGGSSPGKQHPGSSQVSAGRPRISTGGNQAQQVASALVSPASPTAVSGKVTRKVTGELVAVLSKGAISPTSTGTPTSPAQTFRSTRSLDDEADSSPGARSARKFGRLGAHYDFVPPDGRDNHLDKTREDHDAILADTLRKRRPSEGPHPLAGPPRPAATAAFTDRAVRLREGRGAKAALMKDGDEVTEWFKHGNCSCTVCRPSEKHQSGAASHEVWYNRTVRCAKDSTPVQPHWEDGPSKTFTSHGLTRAMSHPELPTNRCEADETQLRKSLGRRGRDISPRSWTTDDRVPSGCFNTDFRPEILACNGKGRQPFQGKVGDLIAPRTATGMALSPREGDPPASRLLDTVHKGKGEFKGGPTRSPQPQRRSQPCKGFMEREERQRPESPKHSPRALVGRSSSLVSTSLNHAKVAMMAEEESLERSRTDAPFMSLCNQTATHLKTQHLLSQEVKLLCGTPKVAMHLVWDGY